MTATYMPGRAGFRTISIRRQLNELTEYFAQTDLAPQEAVQALARVLDFDKGILTPLAVLMATAAVHAENQAEHGTLPAEVCLALGRAANEIDATGTDLHEHTATLKTLSTRPPTTTAPPVPAPLVVRRHR